MSKADKFKVGSSVKVLSGKDKGKVAKIVKLFKPTSEAIVEGVSVVTRSVKPNQANPAGGFIKKEVKISLSKLTLV